MVVEMEACALASRPRRPPIASIKGAQMDDATEEATPVARQTMVEESTVIRQLLETLKQLQTQD